jgi:hypothetical protein
MSDNHNMLHPKNIIFFKNLSLKHTHGFFLQFIHMLIVLYSDNKRSGCRLDDMVVE